MSRSLSTLARSASEGESSRKPTNPRLRFGLVSDFTDLAKRISGWTTNLLATAIVLVGGIALGWQVISWWRDQLEPDATSQAEALAAANLPAAGEGREFWTKSGLLKVERVRGGSSEAIAALRSFCRTESMAAPSSAAGEAEAEFVGKLAQQTPLEEAEGVALYQPRGQTSMVVAVNRQTQRIVAWSFALPVSDGIWSAYHFRPAGGRSTNLTTSIAK
jgi:hypothetical protein